MLLWFAVAVALVVQVKGENLVSCANTPCTGSKVCRIIERCWSKDCQVGTTCIEPQDVPLGSGGSCQYDNPLLHSQDGGLMMEIHCGTGTINPECPAGSTCVEPAGVCCTGAMKNTGACPTKPSHYFLSRGSCKTFCRHDQECGGFQRCCDTGVGCNACMDPVPNTTCETHACSLGFHCVMKESDCFEYPCFAKPNCLEDKIGQCPMLGNQASCADQCMVDSHCPGLEKCCSNRGCSVCVQPGLSFSSPSSSPSPSSSSTLSPFSFSFSTTPPPLNFNGVFGGLSVPTTTAAPSGFPGMSSFLGSGSGGSSSGGSLTGTSGAGGTTSTDLSGTSSLGSYGDLGGTSGSTSISTSSLTSGDTNTFSSMLKTMQNLQQSTGTTTNTGNMPTMMDALRNMQSAGGPSSLSTMLNNYKNMMNSARGGGTLSSLNMLSNPPVMGGGGSSLYSLGGLSPTLSSNTLQTLGGAGGLGSQGGGGGSGGGGGRVGGLMPQTAGLNPQLPSIGGQRMNQGNRRNFQCGSMCMMFMMMGS